MSVTAFALTLCALISAGSCTYEITISAKVTTRTCNSDAARVRWDPIDYQATELTLANCYITDTDEIEDDDLHGLPKLDRIYLHFNDIIRVNTSIFSYVPTVIIISLSYNKLRELTAFSERSCPSLTNLDLSNNQLTNINAEVSACHRLENLYVSSNKIEYIHPDAFSSLTWLRIVMLHNNNIKFIPKELFLNNKRLSKLWLYNNKLTHLPDKFVWNMQYSMDSYFFLFFGNPWDCTCLLELLADIQVERGWREYRRTNPVTYEKHYDGKLPECVFIGRQPCRRLPPSALGQNI